MRAKKHLDLAVDPPPDLVIEIDITHLSLDKLPLYAAAGVPEVWHYDGERVRMLRLTGGCYVEHASSLAFPALQSEPVTELLAASRQMSCTAWLRHARTWAQGHAEVEGKEEPCCARFPQPPLAHGDGGGPSVQRLIAAAARSKAVQPGHAAQDEAGCHFRGFLG